MGQTDILFALIVVLFIGGILLFVMMSGLNAFFTNKLRAMNEQHRFQNEINERVQSQIKMLRSMSDSQDKITESFQVASKAQLEFNQSVTSSLKAMNEFLVSLTKQKEKSTHEVHVDH